MLQTLRGVFSVDKLYLFLIVFHEKAIFICFATISTVIYQQYCGENVLQLVNNKLLLMHTLYQGTVASRKKK